MSESFDRTVRFHVYDSTMRSCVLSLETAWRLARAWYESDRRQPEWRRRTLDETEQLFAELELTGAFWNLR